jgi:magnesium-transporting ATPase (P-type)
LLLNEFVPISMYVTLEIVKVVQCLYVNWDIHMFYHGANTPACARASGLTEELGQVEYILSDKTGTLTQNLMAFIKCSIGGEIYGRSSAESSFVSKNIELFEDTAKSVHNVGHDRLLIDILNNNASNPKTQICRAFFIHVALCHTVIPNYLFDDEFEEIRYQSTSPDETALVQVNLPSALTYMLFYMYIIVYSDIYFI